MKLSEIAVRLSRPLVCGVFGHERWPFSAEQPLWVLSAFPAARTDAPCAELELCRRCGTVYVSRWEWRRDYAATHGIRPVQAAPPPASSPDRPEAA